MFRSNFLNFASLIGLIAMVAVLSCLIAFYLVIRPQLSVSPTHETFVQQLQLSDEQQQRIEAIDLRFEEERVRILGNFEGATRNLAGLLEQEDTFSGEVRHAIEGIHHFHGELQALSIRRYFAILQELPPEKQVELRRLASAALSQPE